MKYKIFNEDCITKMDDLISNNIKVDLTITSPPYDNLRTYKDSLEWNEKVWKQIINKLYNITQDGGIVVWVVNDATVKGSETGTSFKQALYFKEVGFNLHDTMIYQKDGFAFPESNRCHNVFEYMFVFSKGKPKVFNVIKDRLNKNAGSKLTGTDRQCDGNFKKISGLGKILDQFGGRFNIWHIPNQTKDKGHPAVFPEKFANDHIISWSNENDIIFDPMMGSGTVGKMALLNNRRFIGIEKVKEYYDICIERLKQ